MINQTLETAPKVNAPHTDKIIIPSMIRLESSTLCQLKCPTCPTSEGETRKGLGLGYLSFSDFEKLAESNPWINAVELSNWGEMFLNRELVKIMRYADKHKIALYASNGVNLNSVDKNVLEALVKYKLRKISCSIDGASQATYSIYRRNGNFDQVINNIKTINYFKAKYKSMFPQLQWKFIAFGHNEHEIAKARQMARELNMFFYVKLAWEDLYSQDNFSPVKDGNLVKIESGLWAANREEFRKKYGYEYVLRECCLEMWRAPQVNFDGRVLGCSVNYWDDYGDAFKEGLLETINNEKINYARGMLMGKNAVRDDIPCVLCKCYAKMLKNNDWITEREVQKFYTKKTLYTNFIQGVFKNKITNKTYRGLRTLKRKIKPAYSSVKSLLFNNTDQKLWNKGHLKSKVYQLEVPLIPDSERGWRPCFVFKGTTRILENLTCHASVLLKGCCPHPPHSHEEEELLVVLFGEVEIILPGMEGETKTMRLRPGQLVYYPAGYVHTIQTISPMPANYLMFKWKNLVKKINPEVAFKKVDVLEKDEKSVEGFSAELKFDMQTNYLDKLQCHVSRLGPGAGYDAHSDPYDVAIIVFEGEVETLGKRVGPNGVIFYAAGQLHGMYNPCDVPARYVVFEFHSNKKK